ncbi:MAG TPA: B12-binding domain-containing protein [bacterium]|nr:B12-binding domain-containing protein [bacterium]
MATKDLLSTRELARVCGVSESTIKRWADEGLLRCLKTPGGHRKFRLEDLAEFAHTHQFGLEELGELSERQRVQVAVDRLLRARDASSLMHAFLDALLVGDRLTALHLLRRAIDAGYDPNHLADQVVAPAMHAIGERWQCGTVAVHEEHRASQIVLDAIGEIRGRVPEAAGGRPLAVGACPPGEQHVIGLKLILTLLALQGWRTIDLGADTPWDGIAAMAAGQRAEVALVSSSYVPDRHAFVAGYRTMAQALGAVPCRVVVGGGGFTEDLLPDLPHDSHCTTVAALATQLPAPVGSAMG